MRVWAFSDLHLSFSNPDKSMAFFGGDWINYEQKIRRGWESNIQKEDIVLVAGDISWATHFSDALVDLRWIDELPGKKICIKGNHDYWWSSKNKMQGQLPSSLVFLQNDSWSQGNIAVAGSRLWDTKEFHFDDIVQVAHNPRASRKVQDIEQDEKIYARELLRLEASLQKLPADASIRIAMTHYPPIGVDLASSKASYLLEKYRVQICIFGHLHNVKKNRALFGKKGGVHYYLSSCDYLDFTPLQLL